ncbi:MAG: PqiC family protein [Chromatiales bacterium]|jgi:uncharacterized lipoprotein YmbA
MIGYRIFVATALLIYLTACSVGGPTREAHFYVLNSLPGEAVEQTTQQPLSIGVGPVVLPELIERPQIVTRMVANRVELNEFERWGGDLNKNVVQVLSQNLMTRLRTEQVIAYPWHRKDSPDLQVSVRFLRFDGRLGKSADLSGVWQLYNGKQDCQLHSQTFNISTAPPSSDYAGLVAAMSAGLAQLSQFIAAQIAQQNIACKTTP